LFHSRGAWRRVVACILGLALVGAVGCGDDESSDTGAASDAAAETTSAAPDGELTKINVGAIPVANLAPFNLGIQKGFFKEQGLDLNVSSSLSGAPQNVPRLLKGDLQFVATAWLSTMLAREQKLPVIAIAPGDNAGTTADEDYCHVMTAPDGPKELSALKGTTIAINTLKNVGEVSMDAVLDKAGVDPKSVKYVQLPWPEMGAALRNDRIKAGWVCEPFLTQLKQQMKGVNDLGPSQNVAAPKLPISVYTTSEQYMKENPEIVERFQKAIMKSLEYAQQHPDEARAVIPSFTEIGSDVADAMILPTWDTTYDDSAIQALADQSHKYGILKDPVDIKEIMVPLPSGG
jgi:NitT/TauT family transport system substrate-binding protein